MTPLLTVGLKVPVEGSRIIFTEAASESIVKRPINWSAAYQVSFNLEGAGGREDPALVWWWEWERKRREGQGGGLTSSMGKEQGQGGQGWGGSTFVVSFQELRFSVLTPSNSCVIRACGPRARAGRGE